MKHLKTFEGYEKTYYASVNEGAIGDAVRKVANFISDKLPNKAKVAAKIKEVFGIDPYDPNLNRDETIKKIANVVETKYAHKFQPVLDKAEVSEDWDFDDLHGFTGVLKGIIMVVGGLLGMFAVAAFYVSGFFAALMGFVGAAIHDPVMDGPWTLAKVGIIVGCFVWALIVTIVGAKQFGGDDEKWHGRHSGVSDAERHSSAYIASHSY